MPLRAQYVVPGIRVVTTNQHSVISDCDHHRNYMVAFPHTRDISQRST